MQLIVGQFNCQSFLTFLSECTESSDCPNGGQNYECTAELCSCKPGHALDGDACVGMLLNCYFYHSSGFVNNCYYESLSMHLCGNWGLSRDLKLSTAVAMILFMDEIDM